MNNRPRFFIGINLLLTRVLIICVPRERKRLDTTVTMKMENKRRLLLLAEDALLRVSTNNATTPAAKLSCPCKKCQTTTQKAGASSENE